MVKAQSVVMWKTILILYSVSVGALAADSDYDWWRKTIVYQVYPRSFKDSNGDGIGDLNGITSKLEHIKDIGAEAVWLSPIYASPQEDFGYDISNFTNITPEYGTLEDFDKLVAKAKSLGLKVLLDFVPNHSSPEHDWFKKSVKNEKPYDEYYIWRDAKTVNGMPAPPNNWLSSFGGSAWQWNADRKQYYYHQFAVGQPDLNYRSAALRQEMENALLFWLNRGISGFRVDAINTLFETEDLKDEPLSNRPGVPANDTDYLLHHYTIDLDETYDIVKSWRELLDQHSKDHNLPQHVMLTEAYTSIPLTMKYYKYGSSLPMNFYFITEVRGESSAIDMKRTIHKWLNNIPEGYTPNWVTGNHDNHRVATRMGEKREDQITALAMLLPGVPIIYNGDEIGMLDRSFTFEETVDPAGCGAGSERYSLKSRDPERTPFQWDDTTSAGFSTSTDTWLPVNPNYPTLNLKMQKDAKISHYHVFKALTALKKHPVVADGDVEILLAAESVLGVVRRLKPHPPVALLINSSDDPVSLDASGWLNLPERMIIYTASVRSGLDIGSTVDTTKLRLPGAATVVLKSACKE